MTESLTISARERRVAMVNRATSTKGWPVSVDTIDFTNIAPTTLHERNTVAKVIPKAGVERSIFINGRTIYFNRLDLQIAFGPAVLPELILDNIVDTEDLLPTLLERYGVNLTLEDVYNEPVNGGDYTVRALPTSLGWIGHFTFALMHVVVPPGNSTLLRSDDSNLFTIDGLFMRLD